MHSRSRQGSAAWEAVDMRNQEKLYAAYSELHRVAQKTEIPIAAPVVTVVGHQTDGKSGECPLPRLAWLCASSVPRVTILLTCRQGAYLHL